MQPWPLKDCILKAFLFVSFDSYINCIMFTNTSKTLVAHWPSFLPDCIALSFIQRSKRLYQIAFNNVSTTPTVSRDFFFKTVYIQCLTWKIVKSCGYKNSNATPIFLPYCANACFLNYFGGITMSKLGLLQNKHTHKKTRKSNFVFTISFTMKV